MKKAVTAAGAGVGILILILDGQTALLGAMEGLELCLKSVIPSLFPFLFLCGILTNALWGSQMKLLTPLCRKLGIPQGAESLLIAAFLGGYPAGARTVGQSWREGRLTREDALHLLRFCSNAGPAFLFGMTALQFPDLKTVWALWVIQILSALIVGSFFHHRPENAASLSPGSNSVTAILTGSVKTMGVLCGWIILFRMVTEYLTRWFFWMLPPEHQVLLMGLLELSNGCCILSRIPDLSLRFCVCSAILSFGGICVAIQTASVISDLPLKPYLGGKAFQTAMSLPLSLLYLRTGWAGLSAVTVLLFLVLVKKEVDFQKNTLYNALTNTRREKNHAVS